MRFQSWQFIWARAWDLQQCGMCDQQSLRSACAYTQTDESLYWSLEYSMIVKLLTEHHLEFLSLTGDRRCSSSLHGQNVKLLEILCRSLFVDMSELPGHAFWLHGLTSRDLLAHGFPRGAMELYWQVLTRTRSPPPHDLVQGRNRPQAVHWPSTVERQTHIW